MRVLTRMWQMLLKALDEVAAAPNAMMAAEMAIIRLTHVADLPSPDELVKKLQNATPLPPARGGQTASAPATGAQAVAQAQSRMAGNPNAAGQTTALANDPALALARYPTFGHVIELISANRDRLLYEHVVSYVRLAAYQPGRIEFVPAEGAPRDLAQRLGGALQRWTGNRWAVTIVSEGGAPTIYEVEHAEELALKAKAEAHPLVQAVLEHFPAASIKDIRTPDQIAQEAHIEALPEVDDEWDPFEED